MIDILLTNGWLRTSYASLRNLASQGLSVAVSDSRPVGISQFSNKKIKKFIYADYPFYKFDEAWGNEIDDLHFLKLAKKQFFILDSNVSSDDCRLNNCYIYDSCGKKIVRYPSG